MIKKIFIILIGLLFISIPITALAYNDEYDLTGYKVDVKVNEDNTFLVIESITARFNIPKHGIFRKIPLRNEVVRLDGTKSINSAKVTNVKVRGDQYTIFNENGYKVIKIGNPELKITGSKDYTISYLYNIGKDTGKGYDEFYFNLIGPEWDTSISNVEFTILMPKGFDESKLGFSSGLIGATNSGNVTYQVDGNVITGNYNGLLNAGEALTVRLELPDGYFVGASGNLDFIMIIAIILPVLFTGISYLLWIKYGKEDKPVETVEFYPPEGFNSADVGFLYKGKAEKIDVVSLLIYLADKGYIRIEEYNEKTKFSVKKSFKIIKIKEYDGINANEKLFLSGLFKDKMSGAPSFTSLREVFSTLTTPGAYADKVANAPLIKKQEVVLSDLQNNFYTTLNAIIASINMKENKNRIFERESSSKKINIALMMLISFLLIAVKPILEFGGSGLLLVLVFPVIGFSIILASLNGGIPKLFGLIFGLMFGSPFYFVAAQAIQYDQAYIPVFAVGIVCIILMCLLFKFMSKRTPFGNEMLGKIKGFRNFLEAAEKPKLEQLVMQNPSYFYNILPFTYVLGISDKWIKKFEYIALRSPDWYEGAGTFNTVAFGSFMNATMASASTAMSSNPSSDSGSDSGGGSSGGGSGGGGGGSW